MKKTGIFLFIPTIFIVTVIAFANPDPPEIEIKKINEKLYKLCIGSVNAVASIGEDGILLSDTGFEETAAPLMSELKKLGGDSIRYIINTHWHHDHCGGNKVFGKEAVIIAHQNTRKALSRDQILNFWREEYKAFPDYALPYLTFTTQLTLHFNGEEIVLIHLPNGHSDGDVIVYFKNSNVLHMGDLLFSNGFPCFDFENGGNAEQFVRNLQTIIDMMPQDVLLIAGHGPDYSIRELKQYQEMMSATIAIIRDSMETGMSLDEMKRKEILKNYTKWGDGFFTCDEWVENVYYSFKN